MTDAWRSFVGQLRPYDGPNPAREGQWYVYWPVRLWERDETEFALGHEAHQRYMIDWSAWGVPKCHYAATGWSPAPAAAVEDEYRIGHDGRYLRRDDDGTPVLLVPIVHGTLEIWFSCEETRDLVDALRAFEVIP